MARELAILFKAGVDDSGSDPYAETLAEIGIQSIVIPVLKFDFVRLEELTSCLLQNHNYSGIVFSSPRVVEAVGKCSADISKWKNQYAFVVGERTAEEVRRLGLVPIGSDSGTGASLADFILKHNITKPLLLPCGNLSTDILFKKLSDAGVSVHRLVVYQTSPDDNLEQNIAKNLLKLADSKLKFIMYFSPSGVEATLPILERLGLDLSSIKFGAIGPTTQDALSSRVNVSFVSEKPTPQHLAEAVKRTFYTDTS